MSRRRKSQFKWATFTVLPVVLLLAVMVPVLLSASAPAGALNTSDWAKVKGYLNSYITSQYQTDGVDGESGFLIDAVTLKGRTDSNGNNAYLGEGDDAANVPVLVDVLNGGGGGIVQGTAIISNYNTTTADVATTAAIAGKVAAHEAAGFSTDIVSYCLTGHTESVAAGAMGAIAQAGGYGGTTPPKVLDLKWGRWGWNTGSYSYVAGNALGAPSAPGTYANASNANCTGSTPDAELVRCTAAAALSAVGSGTNPPYTTYQVIDLRPGALGSGSVGASTVTNQVPLSTLFNTGLNSLNPGSAIMMANRTQHTAGIAAVGARMLGYNATFTKWGLANYNNTIGEKFTGGAGYGLVAASIDVTAPTISAGPTTANITATSVDIARTTNEPATSKIHLEGNDGHVVDVNNTVLNANKTVTVGGLHAGVQYTGTLYAYDGQANGTSAVIAGFMTTDTTLPTVSNILPTGNFNTNGVSFPVTISADYSDLGSGVNAESVMIHLDVFDMLMDCPVQTTSHVECNANADQLSVGTHSIDVYVEDNAANGDWFHSSVTVVDDKSPLVTGVTGDGTTINANYIDTAPSSGVNTASLNVDIAGYGVVPGCTAVAGAISCPTPPGLTYGPHAVDVSITDNALNVGTGSGTLNIPDVTAPTTTDTAPAGWLNTAVTIDLNCVDTESGCATTSWSGDNGLGSGTGNAVQINNEGSTTITYHSVDAAGNIESDRTGIVNIDMTPPEATDDAPAAWQNADFNVNIGCTDALSGCDFIGWFLDGAFGSGNTIGINTEGDHTITYQARDLAGNTNITQTTHAKLDKSLPVITGKNPQGSSGSTSQTIMFDASDAYSGIDTSTAEFRLDGGAMTGCTIGDTHSSCDVTGLSYATHTVDVQIADNAGNLQTASWSFTVSADAPVIDSWTPTGITTDANPVVQMDYHSSGTIDGSSISLNGVSCAAWIYMGQTYGRCNQPSLADGNYAAIGQVWAGTQVATQSWSFTKDTSPPDTSNNAPAGWNQGDVTVTLTCADATTGCASTTYELDGGATQTGTSVLVSGDGSHTIIYRSTDGAGLTEGDNTATVNIDNTAPVTTDNALPFWQSADPTVTLTCVDAASGCESTSYEIDGGATQSGTSVLVTGEGSHTITYRSTDAVGNTEADKTAMVWIDHTGAQASAESPTGWISGSPATISVILTDNLSDVDKTETIVSIDGTALDPANCDQTGNFSVTVSCTPASPLGPGNHYVDVNSLDNAGNIATTHWTFDIDTTAPVASNNAPVGDITTSTPTLSIDFDDLGGSGLNEASATITVDGVTQGGCNGTPSPNHLSFNCVASTLGAGTHDVVASINDNAGNPGSMTWQINLTQRNYFFPWYDSDPANHMNGDWLMITNAGNAPAGVDIYIGGDLMFQFDGGTEAGHGSKIPAGQQVSWKSDTPVTTGPVRIVSTDGQELLASQRVIFMDSFNEVMAVEESELDSTYYFTWYDNNASWGMNGNWVLAANMGTTAADINVYVGDISDTATPAVTFPSVAPGGIATWQSPTTRTEGPIRVSSDNGNPLLVSQRVIFKDAFNEVMGGAQNNLDTEGFFTWYDNQPSWGMRGNWVLATNVGTLDTTVEIYINNVDINPVATLGPVAPGDTVAWQSPTPLTDGPVRVISTNAQTLLTSERTIYMNSFEEVLGTTPADMGNAYLFNWYDSKSANGMHGDWILGGNYGSGSFDVSIALGGSLMANPDDGGSTIFPIASHTSIFPQFNEQMMGPVAMECAGCTGNGDFLASQRVIYKDSFNEVVGKGYRQAALPSGWSTIITIPPSP